MSDDTFKFRHQGISKTNTYMIEMTVIDLLSSKNLKHHIEHVIASAVRSAILEQYPNLQKIADELVNSQDTRDYIFSKIRSEVDKAVKENIAELFGKVKQ